jgi:hypothetical protein
MTLKEFLVNLGEANAGIEGWKSCNICLEDMADSGQLF